MEAGLTSAILVNDGLGKYHRWLMLGGVLRSKEAKYAEWKYGCDGYPYGG